MYLTVASVAFSWLPVRLQSFLHILICFWVSSWNCLFLAFVHLPIFPSLICEGSSYIVDTNILLQVVSLRLWLVFHFVCNIFYCIQIFLHILKCIHVCHYGSCFFLSYLGNFSHFSVINKCSCIFFLKFQDFAAYY